MKQYSPDPQIQKAIEICKHMESLAINPINGKQNHLLKDVVKEKLTKTQALKISKKK